MVSLLELMTEPDFSHKCDFQKVLDNAELSSSVKIQRIPMTGSRDSTIFNNAPPKWFLLLLLRKKIFFIKVGLFLSVPYAHAKYKKH